MDDMLSALGGAVESFFADKRKYRGHSLLGFIIGLPIPLVSIWLWTRLSTGTGCETFINTPLLVVGILVIVFSIFGACANKPLSTSCCMRETIVYILLFTLLGYGIFVFAVSSSGGGHVLPGKAYQEYVLEDYSHWLQKRVNNSAHWDGHLKKCLLKKNVCHKFYDKYANDTLDFFFTRNLSSIESGCCKPPTNCNFTYTSPKEWSKPMDGNNTNMDCNSWDDDPNVRCFNCQSCKAGFANNVKNNWIIVGVVIIVVFCFVIFVSPCASCKGGPYSALIANIVMNVALGQMDGLMDKLPSNLFGSEHSSRSSKKEEKGSEKL